MRTSMLMVTVVLTTAACAAAADWPQFLGPGRDGVAPDAKIPRSWPEGGPKELWTVKLGVGFGGPSIRDGKVYVLDRVDDARDVLRCLDLATGQEQWSFAYEAPGKLSQNGSRGTPTVGEKYVFTIGPFGHFHCVDKATHKPVWNKHLLEDFAGKRPNWGVSQSPVLYKNAVIAAPLSRTTGVAAFEKATGRMLWKSPPFSGMAYASPVVTTIGGVEQVVMVGTQRVAGVDAASGKLLWAYGAYRCQIPIPGPTFVGDGRIFLTGGYDAGSAMFKVEAAQSNTSGSQPAGREFTATTLFKVPEHGSQIHNALLYEGHLYLACNTNSKRDGLVCMDLEGNVKWKTGRSPNFERGNLILADGILLLMDGQSGVLRMVQPDPKGYQQIAEAKILSGKEIWAPMALSDGKLVLRDQRQMKCLELSAGE